MSIATVVTRGFGSFGSVNKLPTLGYHSQDEVEVGDGYCHLGASFVDGSKIGSSLVDGVRIGASFVDGCKAGVGFPDMCRVGSSFTDG